MGHQLSWPQTPWGSLLLVSLSWLALRPPSQWPSVLRVCCYPNCPERDRNTVHPVCFSSPFQNYEMDCFIFPITTVSIPLGLLSAKGTKRPDPLSRIHMHTPHTAIVRALPFWVRIANLRFFLFLGQIAFHKVMTIWRKQTSISIYSFSLFKCEAPIFFFLFWTHKLVSSPCFLIHSVLTLGFF